MPIMEYKTVPAEFRTVGDQGEYEGHFAVFGNVDDGMDVIMPGAFSKTIVERRGRIRPFFMHDMARPMGPPPEMLAEDSTGLIAKGRMTLANSDVRNVWELMKDGALPEGSIGFQTIPDRTEYNQDGVRLLQEVKLFEYSFVPLGMNPLTSVAAIKALRGGEAQTEAYLNILSDVLGELKVGRMLSAANLEKIRATHSAMSDVMGILAELIAAAAPEDGKSHHPAEGDEAAPETSSKVHHPDHAKMQIWLMDAQLELAKHGVYVS